VPNAIIQIENAPGLDREIRVPWEDPTTMSPRAKCIGAEPAPQGRPANLSDQPLFTGESFNLDYDAGGKSGRNGRPEVEPRGREAARANRLRHLLTIWRAVSRRAAMTSFSESWFRVSEQYFLR